MKPAERVSSYKESPDGRSATIAARQHGVITRAQALSSGLTPSALGRRLSSGRLRRIHPGVYGLAGTRRTWEQEILAACIWSEGVASHRAAARIWRLAGPWPEVVEVTTGRRVADVRVTVHVGRPDRMDATSVGPIPVTTVSRTLLDLGAVADRSAVEAAVSDALRRGMVTTDRLWRCLGEVGGRGRRGAKVLRSILEVVGDHRPESVLELRLIRLIRRSGLPEPVSQYGVRQGGRVVARVDLAYPSIRLAIEADGYRYHGGPDAWRRDLARRNALTALGWHTVHVTWDDVSAKPDRVIRQIRDAMAIEEVGSRRA